jgi:hypothetical protein
MHMSSDLTVVLGWLLAGWVLCLALGVAVGRRTRWQRGFMAFLVAFGMVCPTTLWLALPEAPAHTPTVRTAGPSHRIGIVDLKRILTKRTFHLPSESAWTNQWMTGQAEINRLNTSGDTQSAAQRRQSLHVEMAERQKQFRTEIMAEVLAIIRQRADELKLDAVLDAPEAPQPHNALTHNALIFWRDGLVDLTQDVERGLARRHKQLTNTTQFKR